MQVIHIFFVVIHPHYDLKNILEKKMYFCHHQYRKKNVTIISSHFILMCVYKPLLLSILIEPNSKMPSNKNNLFNNLISSIMYIENKNDSYNILTVHTFLYLSELPHLFSWLYDIFFSSVLLFFCIVVNIRQEYWWYEGGKKCSRW